MKDFISLCSTTETEVKRRKVNRCMYMEEMRVESKKSNRGKNSRTKSNLHDEIRWLVLMARDDENRCVVTKMC